MMDPRKSPAGLQRSHRRGRGGSVSCSLSERQPHPQVTAGSIRWVRGAPPRSPHWADAEAAVLFTVAWRLRGCLLRRHAYAPRAGAFRRSAGHGGGVVAPQQEGLRSTETRTARSRGQLSRSPQAAGGGLCPPLPTDLGLPGLGGGGGEEELGGRAEREP